MSVVVIIHFNTCIRQVNINSLIHREGLVTLGTDNRGVFDDRTLQGTRIDVYTRR